MHHLMRIPGIIITLTLLLTVAVGTVQAGQEKHEPDMGLLVSTRDSTDDGKQAEDEMLVCLMLVSSMALLAGTVWMGKLRRMHP